MLRILLAEDDPLIVEGLSELLANEGYAVVSSPTQTGAVELACAPDADIALALVDLTLAEGSGFAVCNAIKQVTPQVPVIFLTAADDELSTVTGLTLGADDYIAKPFRPRELVARVQAAIRRARPERSVTHLGSVTIDLDRARAEKNGQEVPLSALEYRLLLLFANSTHQMGNWGMVFLVTLALVYVVTAIIAHIPPLSRVPDDYYNDVTPDPEVTVKTNILSEALHTGVEIAAKAQNPVKACLLSGKNALVMVATIHVSAVATWVSPALVNKYTPIFHWLGNLFLPILNFLGMPNSAELSQAIGLSFVNPISATVSLGALDLAPAAQFFAATFAAPIVISFPASPLTTRPA